MAERHVTVGDRPYTIQRFRGLKGEIAGLILKKVTSQAQDVLKDVAAFERQWHEDNKIRVTREFCAGKVADFKAAVRQAEKLAETAPEVAEEVAEGQQTRLKTKAEHEADARVFAAHAASWEQQAEELGERGYIELPNTEGPPTEEIVLAGFQKAFDTARAEVKQLMALVVMPNDDLEKAYEASDDEVEAKLKELGNQLFAQGYIDELMELAVEAAETLIEEMEKYQGPLGKLQALYNRALGNRQKSTGSSSTPSTETPTPPEAESPSTSPTSSPSESPTGSISSPASTDGIEERSSSEPVGASSLPSPTE